MCNISQNAGQITQAFYQMTHKQNAGQLYKGFHETTKFQIVLAEQNVKRRNDTAGTFLISFPGR